MRLHSYPRAGAPTALMPTAQLLDQMARLREIIPIARKRRRNARCSRGFFPLETAVWNRIVQQRLLEPHTRWACRPTLGKGNSVALAPKVPDRPPPEPGSYGQAGLQVVLHEVKPYQLQRRLHRQR